MNNTKLNSAQAIGLPLVSIIIPCYNNEEHIELCCASCIAQSYKNIEIILVDDGSTDASRHLMDKAARDFPHIAVISQPNQGPAAARNKGFEMSRGKYVVFVDADDKLHEDYIRECVLVYLQFPGLNIVYSEAEYFDDKQGRWKLEPFEVKQLLYNNCIPVFPMIPAATFKGAGMFDEKLHYFEDWELWIRIAHLYGGIYRINKVMYYYRKSGKKSSVTDQTSSSYKQVSYLYIYNKHAALYQQHGLHLDMLLKTHKYNDKYREKYYNEWYRKYFYFLFRKKEYREIYVREDNEQEFEAVKKVLMQ